MTLHNVGSVGIPVKRFDLEPGSTYSLEITAHVTGVSRRNILLYCKAGLVWPIVQEPFGALFFNDEAIHAIRRVEHLRTVCGINLQGIQVIFSLMREMEELREEIRFLRGS